MFFYKCYLNIKANNIHLKHTMFLLKHLVCLCILQKLLSNRIKGKDFISMCVPQPLHCQGNTSVLFFFPQYNIILIYHITAHCGNFASAKPVLSYRAVACFYIRAHTNPLSVCTLSCLFHVPSISGMRDGPHLPF